MDVHVAVATEALTKLLGEVLIRSGLWLILDDRVVGVERSLLLRALHSRLAVCSTRKARINTRNQKRGDSKQRRRCALSPHRKNDL
jgi:hypothetical protein